MNFSRGSLRLRLLVLILLPLLVVSSMAVYWRYESARQTAEEIFDRNLVMLSIAVSRDVAYSGGDTLSETTSNLMQAASGGPVFYHVYGPDGSFITGYSSPPVRDSSVVLPLHAPALFDARHLGNPVRVASLAEPVEISGIAGVAVVTVWQELQPRQAFARELGLKGATLAAILVLTVVAVVVFGVRLGLKPLEQLEAAIQKRSTTDLSPIVRRVPVEAAGIVSRLNELFARLSEAQAARERLISNAAHQLRNPVAGIHLLAQATMNARTLKDSQNRARELVAETRRTVRLTKQMLSLERMQGQQTVLAAGDLRAFLIDFTQRIGAQILTDNLEFDVNLPEKKTMVAFDETLMGEALTNLVDNARKHGGQGMRKLGISLETANAMAWVSVSNDGTPAARFSPEFFERFAQGAESEGAGLGLAIVQEIVDIHAGRIEVSQDCETCVSIGLPLVDPVA